MEILLPVAALLNAGYAHVPNIIPEDSVAYALRKVVRGIHEYE